MYYVHIIYISAYLGKSDKRIIFIADLSQTTHVCRLFSSKIHIHIAIQLRMFTAKACDYLPFYVASV